MIQLRGYQQRWIDDKTRFKLAVKSARIGYSFGTGIDHIFRRLEHANSTTTVLSASQPQSNEFVGQCRQNVQAIGAVADLYEERWRDDIGATDFLVQRIQFSNGARIMALAANPRTARGYPGDAVLDEFAHHEHSYAIWAAVFRQVALGNRLDALSTANGEGGKFFDLAKDLGLAEGVAPDPNPVRQGPWSGHWIDVHMAVAEGCPINIEEMREGIKDGDTWEQEFLCHFLAGAGAWLPLELIQSCENPSATVNLPSGFDPRGRLVGGLDVARDRNLTSFWLKEQLGDVLWTRMVLHIFGQPLTEQARTLKPYIALTTRTAMDSTGMGVGLFDILNEQHPGRIMGVNFAGSSRIRQEAKERSKSAKSNSEDGAVRLKVDLAIRLKRSMEGGKERIPFDLDIRNQLMTVKKVPTATGVTFDAPEIEVESAVAGAKKKKAYAHADDFWGCALATYAAGDGIITLDAAKSPIAPSYTQVKGFL